MFTEYEYFIVVMLLAMTILFSLRKKADVVGSTCLISQDTSHIMKAMCCILIILHHWAFRAHSPLSESSLTGLWGGYSLSVFFMLSSYGIAKSELKKSLSLRPYVQHRIWKILKPYLIVVLFILAVYWLIGASYPIEELRQYRVSEYFILIGEHKLGLAEYLGLVANGKSLSFHLWFVEVTIISYICFFLSKSIFNIYTKKVALLVTYAMLILGISVTLMLTVHSFPYLAFVRNVPMMIVGLFLALFEKSLVKSVSKVMIWFVLFNVLTSVYSFLLEHSLVYVMYSDYALLSVYVSTKVLNGYQLKKDSPIMLLSALSYVVYLIHASVLTVEWWYIGFKSALLAVAASILFAYIYKCASERKIIKINV